MEDLLIRGRTGPDVVALKKALRAALGAKAAGFPGLASGSTLDADTEAAARRWQSGVGIVADGVVGPRCQLMLGLRTEVATAVPLSLGHVRRLFPATKPSNIERYLPYVAAALQARNLVDRPMICSALGTIRAESEGFVPISEFQSQFNTPPGGPAFSLYDGRLGNKAGEGARFRGRGFIQLTGRVNYETYGKQLGIDLAGSPDLANAPEVAALLLVRFLADKAVPMRAALAAQDLRKARRLVNGGSHGLDRYSSVFSLAAAVWPAGAAGLAGGRRRAAKGKVAARAGAEAKAARSRRPLTARKDNVDLRDRPFQPLPITLQNCFPSNADIAKWLPVYSRAGLILDQGQEGACTGFGLACVVNYLRWVKAGTPMKLASVSPRMLYTFARRYDEYAGEDYDGSSCRGALKGWFRHGVCLEEDWPYEAPDGSSANLQPRFGYADRATHNTLGVYFRVDLRSVTDLQAAIQQVGAVYVSAFTHDGWDHVPSRRLPKKGHPDLPAIPFDGRPSQTGGHAFAFVGFNDRGFVLQNSWGTDWGCGGFAVMTYEDWLANGMDAWVAALGVPGVVSGRIAVGTGSAGGAAQGADKTRWWGEDLAYRHSVVLGNDGRVKRYLTEDEASRTLLHQAAGLPDQWFRERTADSPRRLVIYAHGGLNGEGAAIERARAMGRHFAGNGCYPLFLVWKTGLAETIGNILSEAWRDRKHAPAATGIGEWITDRTDLLVETTIGRPVIRPVWSEMKENAELAFGEGRGGQHLVTAIKRLAETWGDAFELHLVGHSAGAILLGHMLTALAARGAASLVKSVHLYAPACTVAFANRHYAVQPGVMARLYLDLLSDRVERADSVVGVYRKSLLYLVSNALEADRRMPLLGLANSFDPGYSGWDGTSSTGDALRAWRDAAAAAGLNGSGAKARLALLDDDRVVAALPDSRIAAAHGSFDNDVAILGRTIKRITGAAPVAPIDDLRGF